MGVEEPNFRMLVPPASGTSKGEACLSDNDYVSTCNLYSLDRKSLSSRQVWRKQAGVGSRVRDIFLQMQLMKAEAFTEPAADSCRDTSSGATLA